MLRIAEESYFYFPVEIFEKSERKRKVNSKKVYIVNTGLPHGAGLQVLHF